MNIKMNNHEHKLAEDHREWLSKFENQYLANWEKNLENSVESALVEAGFRKLLEENGLTVEPNEDLTGKTRSPDFLCKDGDSRFLVEVTHISVDVATKITGINAENKTLQAYNPLTNKIQKICQKKAPQCAKQNLPVLLAIGCFDIPSVQANFKQHVLETILTGIQQSYWIINPQTNETLESFEATGLRSSAFLAPALNGEIGFERCSISGLLFWGVGTDMIAGMLHPNPARPLPSDILPEIPFGTISVNEEDKTLSIKWTKDNFDQWM